MADMADMAEKISSGCTLDEKKRREEERREALKKKIEGVEEED